MKLNLNAVKKSSRNRVIIIERKIIMVIITPIFVGKNNGIMINITKDIHTIGEKLKRIIINIILRGNGRKKNSSKNIIWTPMNTNKPITDFIHCEI